MEKLENSLSLQKFHPGNIHIILHTITTNHDTKTKLQQLSLWMNIQQHKPHINLYFISLDLKTGRGFIYM